MLSAATVKKIRRLHIRSRRLVDRTMAGHYRSVFRGTGIEFEEVRAYAPGDDVKHIDWKVSARLGRPFVKLYREEREREVMLLVDVSASGHFGTAVALKRQQSAEIAALLAFNAVFSNDRVGAILFSDRIEQHIAASKGPSHVWRLIRAIFETPPSGRGTDIESALFALGRAVRRRALVFMISDFQDRGFGRQLVRAAGRHEIIGVLLSDAGDFRLPSGGMVTVRDPETGQTARFDAADPRVHQACIRREKRFRRRTRRVLSSAGVDCLEVRTDEDCADALRRYFLRRRGRGRVG